MSHPIQNGYHKENKVMKNTNRDEMKKESIYTVVENVSSPDWKLVTFFFITVAKYLTEATLKGERFILPHGSVDTACHVRESMALRAV